MESRVKLLGHSVHQMLVAFPLGLLTVAVVFDLIYVVSGGAVWTVSAFYMIAPAWSAGSRPRCPAGWTGGRFRAGHGRNGSDCSTAWATSWCSSCSP